MIVLNILSFGRYLLLKRFWSRTLLVLQLHCERIACLLKLTVYITVILHFISTGSCAFNDAFNIYFY